MANSSAKRIAHANRAFLRALLYAKAAADSITVLVLLAVCGYPVIGWNWWPYYTAMVATAVLYRMVHGMGGGGVLTQAANDAAVDLAAGAGLHQYVLDVMYVVMGAQVLSLVSAWAWGVLLVIPAYAAYRVFGLVRPLLQGLTGAGSGVPSMPAGAPAPAAATAGRGRGGAGGARKR
ncbi:hypothetical protein GGF31_007863 [Allomyces arbusculus]|nr:hypothetical protein GGF31_007863 [Allomyces arbusculus]